MADTAWPRDETDLYRPLGRRGPRRKGERGGDTQHDGRASSRPSLYAQAARPCGARAQAREEGAGWLNNGVRYVVAQMLDANIRFSGLIANSLLELVAATSSSTSAPGMVNIALQLESGERRTAKLSNELSLLQVAAAGSLHPSRSIMQAASWSQLCPLQLSDFDPSARPKRRLILGLILAEA
eukprot:472319-Pleurochrysis_carterae.AAC.3